MRFPWQIIRKAVSRRAHHWARRRQGRDAPQLILTSRRIYILPTASGLVFALMVATMLAGAMNYNNNLGFALTFMLTGIGIVTIYHTHRTLSGLRLNYLGAESVFAGDTMDVRFALVNAAPTPRDEIFLDWEDAGEIPAGVAPLDSRTIRMPLPTHQRGFMPLPGLRVCTRAPLGLVRAWAWIHMEASPLVWPRPAVRFSGAQQLDSDAPRPGLQHKGEDDFAGLRSYQHGDSPRRIAWKSYARSGDLLVRDYRGGSPEDPVWIDWDALPPGDVETRVARLTRMVIDAFEADRSWGLRMPGSRIDPAHGREHLHRCLRRLATVGLPAASG